MSRYTILVLLNTPLILYALLNATVLYKIKRLGRKHYLVRIGFWLCILAGLLSAESIYNFLIAHNLTRTESLSLFDVIQITGIVTALLIANKANTRTALLEKRLQELHREVSISLSQR